MMNKKQLHLIVHVSLPSFIVHHSEFIVESWRSELESNQPFGLFRPALIRLSYPTRDIVDCQLIADFRVRRRRDV